MAFGTADAILLLEPCWQTTVPTKIETEDTRPVAAAVKRSEASLLPPASDSSSTDLLPATGAPTSDASSHLFLRDAGS